MSGKSARGTTISMASASDRQNIYAMRYAVYAEELRQHPANTAETLSDSLDDFNEYIVAHIDGRLAGFISVTPPGAGRYSIDKYVKRSDLPVAFDDGLYELRVLTVAGEHRSSRLAATLMYAAFRWAEDQGAQNIIAMGRTEVMSIYLKHGMRLMGMQVKSGAVTFELLQTEIGVLRRFAERHHNFYSRLLKEVSWKLDIPFFKTACCFHGGAFFESIGEDFQTLERRQSVINADVLDAWFPPAPQVLRSLTDHLEWILRSSPPTHSRGLRDTIARFRGIAPEHVLPAAGSSALIYTAFTRWLGKDSHVLILDPMYGEYAHVLQNVIGCHVQRFALERSAGYEIDMEKLEAELAQGYDMVVLVNPNNPTGRFVPRPQMERLLANVPASTRVWVDEAYLDYAGHDQSLETFAAGSENIIVCKTMSKAYALSGLRVGYLCAGLHQISSLAPFVPPWAVGLPAQVAAVRALENQSYYIARYLQTQMLRAEMVSGLKQIGIREIVPGVANFVLFHLHPDHPTSAEVVNACREHNVFLRNVANMGTNVGPRALRTAVKDRKTNARILATLETILARQSTRSDLVTVNDPKPADNAQNARSLAAAAAWVAGPKNSH